MTARTTMANLITTLRGMTNAGTADYTSGGATWWTDDQIEDVLDQNRREYKKIGMTAKPTYGVGGSVTYTEYSTGLKNWEDTPTIQDSAGSAITAGTTTYGFDTNTGVATFVADTGGSAYYITGKTYNLYRAAAQVWERKAAYYATAYDFSSDNHSLKRSQIADGCLRMAKHWKSLDGSDEIDSDGSVYAERSDT